MRLLNEQSSATSVLDQVKAMEARLQDRMVKQMEDMESSFKDLLIAQPGLQQQQQQQQVGVQQVGTQQQAVPLQQVGAQQINQQPGNPAPQTGNPTIPGIQQGVSQRGVNVINPISPQASGHTPPTPIPMAQTMAALTQSVDRQLCEEKRGNKYCPEFYVQSIDNNVPIKNIDFMKLSHRELVHGSWHGESY